MKANELLESQHRLVEKLFERFENARSSEKPRLFEELAKNLVAHDAIERELFYPACEAELDEEDILGESLVEHGLVEFSIFRADKNKSSDDLDKYVTVLKEVVEHHVEEEEKELLPKVRRALDKQRLESLGQQMEERFAEAMQSDFRRPLRNALKQVLEGRMKTTKKRGGSSRKVSATVKRASTPRASSRSAARTSRSKTSRSKTSRSKTSRKTSSRKR